MRHETVAKIGLAVILLSFPFKSIKATELEIVSGDHLAFVGQKLAEWQVVLGGGIMMAPKYEGSDEFDLQPIPFITASLGEHVKVDPRGVSIEVYSLNDLTFSGQIGYDIGRKDDDSEHLRGLGDIDMGGVVGGTVTYEMGPAEFYASLSRNIGGSEGTEAKFGVDIVHFVDRFRFSAGLSATWADETYMETYFCVSAAQSAASGLPQYDIGAGFKRIDLDLSVTYGVTENWLVRGQIGLGHLIGDAADSPIVQEAFQPSGIVAIGYRF